MLCNDYYSIVNSFFGRIYYLCVLICVLCSHSEKPMLFFIEKSTNPQSFKAYTKHKKVLASSKQLFESNKTDFNHYCTT